MRANVGDLLTVRGRRVGDRTRAGKIMEVHGSNGSPPYVVRWDGEAGEHLIYPGSDAMIDHAR